MGRFSKIQYSVTQHKFEFLTEEAQQLKLICKDSKSVIKAKSVFSNKSQLTSPGRGAAGEKSWKQWKQNHLIRSSFGFLSVVDYDSTWTRARCRSFSVESSSRTAWEPLLSAKKKSSPRSGLVSLGKKALQQLTFQGSRKHLGASLKTKISHKL